MPQTLSCWIMTNGVAGNENQCIGLAEALGLEPVVKRIVTRKPFLLLPPRLPFYRALALSPHGDQLRPPWPDLLIASGWQSAVPALSVRASSRRQRPGRPTRLIQIQKPQVPAALFDLVVAPAHDRLSGGNVLTTIGSIHRVSATRLASAAPLVADSLAGLPRPLVAVLLGGSTRLFRFGTAEAASLGDSLAAMARREGASLLVTGSRRTSPGVREALLERLADVPHRAWDGSGENPYFGWLAEADAAVVTSDSVNMTSEAAAAGLPVLVVSVPGGNAKFTQFHQAMRAAGLARPFTGQLDRWRQPPFDEPGRLAREVKARLPLAWP